MDFSVFSVHIWTLAGIRQELYHQTIFLPLNFLSFPQILFHILFLNVCVCVHVDRCQWMQCLQRPESSRGWCFRQLWAVNIGARYQTWVIFRRNMHCQLLRPLSRPTKFSFILRSQLPNFSCEDFNTQESIREAFLYSNQRQQVPSLLNSFLVFTTSICWVVCME